MNTFVLPTTSNNNNFNNNKTTKAQPQQQQLPNNNNNKNKHSTNNTNNNSCANENESVAEPLSVLLHGLIRAQQQPHNTPTPATVFDGTSGRPPAISLRDFVARIETYSGCTRATVVASLVYLDRLLVRHPLLRLTETNVHRLLWTCLVVAVKHYEDNFFTNAHYSKVGGVTLQEMNRLELTLLVSLAFELYITPQQYAQYDAALNASRDYCRAREQQTLAVVLPTSQVDSAPVSTTPTSNNNNWCSSSNNNSNTTYRQVQPQPRFVPTTQATEAGI